MLKKIYFIIFMLIFVFVNSISFATIMIGAKGGYFFWRPMLKDSGADWASVWRKF